MAPIGTLPKTWLNCLSEIGSLAAKRIASRIDLTRVGLNEESWLGVGGFSLIAVTLNRVLEDGFG